LCAKDGVLIQASKLIDLKIGNEFEFEIQTTLIIQTKLVQDFIKASTVHSETLLEHCSGYSNTRGVTPCQESGEALRARGPPRLSGALIIARAWKLCQNPSGSDRVSRL
jgi:hypothetical protein